jgi:hypothetical protein
MGMTAADLLQRLRACETVLADCEVGLHGLLSKGQSEVVLAMMSQTTISSDDVGTVTEQILKCRWADPAEKTALLKNVGSMTRSVRPRAKLQDFESLAMFIPEHMWAVLQDATVDYHGKAAALCDFALALQLRHPTEPTIACMVALLLLVTEGSMKARTMSPAYHHDLFVSLKDMLKKRCKKLGSDPVAVVEQLGADPALFMAQHPDLAAAVYARGGPAPPKVAMHEITMICNSINMRKGGRPTKTLNPFAGTGASSSDPFQAMMQQFMMQSMGTMLGRPAAGSRLLPGGAQLQIFGAAALPDAARLPPTALQITDTVQPSLASLPPPLEQVATQLPLGPVGAALLLEPVAVAKQNRSVDEAAAAIMNAMGKRADVREVRKNEMKNQMKRPAAAMTGKLETPPLTVKPEKQPVTGKLEKPPLFSVEASRSQVLYRSGLSGKGQTKVFKYGNEKEKKRALASAEALVVAEKHRRCL